MVLSVLVTLSQSRPGVKASLATDINLCFPEAIAGLSGPPQGFLIVVQGEGIRHPGVPPSWLGHMELRKGNTSNVPETFSPNLYALAPSLQVLAEEMVVRSRDCVSILAGCPR